MDCISKDLSVMVLNVLLYCLFNYCESNSEELLIHLFYSYSTVTNSDHCSVNVAH